MNINCGQPSPQAYFKSYGANKDHNHYGIESKDSIAVVLGTTYPVGQLSSSDIHLQVIDNNGNVLTENLYNINAQDKTSSHVIHGDTVTITGITKVVETWYAYIVQLNMTTGSVINSKRIDVADFRPSEIVYVRANNSYYITGKDMKIFNISAGLSTIWSKDLEAQRGTSIIEVENLGVFVTGYKLTNNYYQHHSINIMLDYNGNVIWQDTYLTDATYSDGLDVDFDAANNELVKVGGSNTAVDVTRYSNIGSTPNREHHRLNLSPGPNYGLLIHMPKNIICTDSTYVLFGHIIENDYGYSNYFPLLIQLEKSSFSVIENSFLAVSNGNPSFGLHENSLTYGNFSFGARNNFNGITNWNDQISYITYVNGSNNINFALNKLTSSIYSGINCENSISITDSDFTSANVSDYPLSSFSSSMSSLNVTKSNIYHQDIYECVSALRTKKPKSEETHDWIIGEVEKTMALYPNPTDNFVTIQLNEAVEKAQIRVMNLNGQVLIESSILGANKKEINVSTLSEGIYIIECNWDGVSKRKKLIIY